jgi:putative restriction endonuclease
MLPNGAAWCQASWVTRDELLELLARLRCAPVGRARLRAPHKPLLLLWLFGRFAASGSTVTAYADAEEPVSALINDFGPPVASAAAARRRAAMPFIHLNVRSGTCGTLPGLRSGRGFPRAGPG